MNRSEKESLLKNFILFFLLLEILLSIIFIFYYNDKIQDIKQLLLKRMQVCSYTLQCKDFQYDFLAKKKSLMTNRLYTTPKELYALYPIPNSKKYLLKVSYSHKNFQKEIGKLKQNIIYLFIFASLIILGISFLLTLYTLRPIREALHINQEFIKDILHDFNTPISSMLINLSMLKRECKSPFISRIEQSLNTIVALQDNLKLFLKNIKPDKTKVSLNTLLKERVEYFRSLYPDLTFSLIAKEDLSLMTQKELFIRIIDNLLSNACKYNKKGGFVKIYIEKNRIIIEDNGRGIKNSQKVFDRFYKESDRGIGIGLSIVKKLCEELDIDITLQSKPGEGTKVYLDFTHT
ncbi:sensor histidine kinase [Nitratiruptor tergarcus]|uniref:histidine kinase n=1 Tax=Nitratiruptor tergarcus DSM 16512 TaxID=1069081 RepID=A0A1W1WQG2_9BACT|nr:HAMP domain-containing sensor histidine kinase [Nitratiruptor tergarcus]SMC08445.1 His Kinase A (phospho-acceptor) domain-containing protein [Nitratiruptor tergarcus DSM 16512]